MNGEPQLKTFLAPGGTYLEESFIGHVWKITDDKTGQTLKTEKITQENHWISAFETTYPSYPEPSSGLPSYDDLASNEKR